MRFTHKYLGQTKAKIDSYYSNFLKINVLWKAPSPWYYESWLPTQNSLPLSMFSTIIITTHTFQLD